MNGWETSLEWLETHQLEGKFMECEQWPFRPKLMWVRSRYGWQDCNRSEIQILVGYRNVSTAF